MSPRGPETGSAMLVTMIVIAALLGGAAVLTSLQRSSTRSTGLLHQGMSALYCAEAGLATARAAVVNSYAQWNAALGQAEPAWLAALDHDLDGDGAADFVITLRDNDDEALPLADDPTQDNDLSIFIVSSCIRDPEIPVQVSELVRYNGGGGCYQSQLGGCGGNGNAN